MSRDTDMWLRASMSLDMVAPMPTRGQLRRKAANPHMARAQPVTYTFKSLQHALRGWLSPKVVAMEPVQKVQRVRTTKHHSRG